MSQIQTLETPLSKGQPLGGHQQPTEHTINSNEQEKLATIRNPILSQPTPNLK